MSQQIDIEQSRTLGVAQRLTGMQVNANLVYSKTVILTGEATALSTQNGKWCFIDSLRLLSRVVGNLQVVLPEVESEFKDEVQQLCRALWARQPIAFFYADTKPELTTAAAILNIGCATKHNLPWTSINSCGWVARVTSGIEALPASYGQPNPVAALMAASLGVSEVFKRIFEVSAEKAPLLDKVEFSLFDLCINPTGIGPELPERILIPDSVLFGAGAIGNAIVLTLSQLPLLGRLMIVDKQDYAKENWETCCQTESEGWIGYPKALRLASWLREHGRLDVTGQKNLIVDAISTSEFQAMSIDLVLNGLDDVQARHDAQMLWPSVIIDGGINEIGAAVVQHRVAKPEMACLFCSFKLPEENVIQKQRKVTGLDTSSLEEQNREITEEDVAKADADRRPWLKEMLKAKRTVCSVISEAFKTLGVDAEEGFQPSAPFVASAAAALVVGEAIKALCYPEIRPIQRFVMANLFLGPDASARLSQNPSTGCRCVVHRNLIVSANANRTSVDSRLRHGMVPAT